MKKIRKRKKVVVWSVVLMLILSITIVCVIFIDNRNMDFESFELNNSENTDITEIKVAHLSDLHFPKIKIDEQKLIDRLNSESVNLIAVTGDLIDGSADIDTCGVYAFIDRLINVAPIFYVNGNHESNHKDAKLIYAELMNRGITVLQNESVNVTVANKKITLIGLTDNTDYGSESYKGNTEVQDNYKILLAHRPEKWLTYSSNRNAIAPDLVLSGHAHGGQIRFFNQGLYAPGQGFFPDYDSGLYVSDNEKTKMIVSRGLGNSIIPFRFNNKPHVPIIKIYL